MSTELIHSNASVSQAMKVTSVRPTSMNVHQIPAPMEAFVKTLSIGQYVVSLSPPSWVNDLHLSVSAQLPQIVL